MKTQTKRRDLMKLLVTFKLRPQDINDALP